MNIALIFSPFVDPTYVPIGIAQLKSYVEEKNPDAHVRLFDFNNIFFNQAAKRKFWDSYRTLCSICPKHSEQSSCGRQTYFAAKRELYACGARCAHGSLREQFFDITSYNRFVQEISRSCAVWYDCFSLVTQDILEGTCLIPAALRNFLKCYVDAVISEKPALIGFSIFCGMQLSYSLLLAKMLKELIHVPVVFGGAAMAHVAAREFLDTFDYIDFVIAQEGEIGFEKLIEHLKGKDFKDVPGLFYRKDNTICHNDECYLDSLDILPFPDFKDYDLRHYFSPSPVLPLITSRGCYWHTCTFCSYSKSYPKPYIAKSIPRLIAEIRHFVSQGIKYFMIDDDIISAKHLGAISEALIKENIEIRFGAITRPEKSFSQELFKRMYLAGGRLLLWGVESSNERILSLMKKGTHVRDVASLLRNAARAGFTNHCFMIIGFPTQTMHEIANDLRFLLDNKDLISFHLHDFLLKKGSYIFEHQQEFGITATKEIPVFTRNGKVLHDDSVICNSAVKLDWAKIKVACGRLEQLFLHNRFQNTGHAHAVILASYNKKVML